MTSSPLSDHVAVVAVSYMRQHIPLKPRHSICNGNEDKHGARQNIVDKIII